MFERSPEGTLEFEEMEGLRSNLKAINGLHAVGKVAIGVGKVDWLKQRKGLSKKKKKRGGEGLMELMKDWEEFVWGT